VPLGGACRPVICLDLDDDDADMKRCEQCQEGLVCYQEACRPDWQLGEACSDAGACWPSAWCDVTLGQCVPRATAGEPCDRSGFKAPFCVEGYFCSAPHLEIGTCLPKSAPGGPCIEQHDCTEAEQRCIPSEDPVALGTCGPPAPLASPCRWAEDCVSGFCAADEYCRQPAVGVACIDHCGEGYDCVDGSCAAHRFPDDPCAATDACQQSRCRDGVCALRHHVGEVCADDDDCLSRRCEQGACADPADCPKG
jgi:hypothetical protein